MVDENGFEHRLKSAFNSGYSNAASSLSKMTNYKVNVGNCHDGFHTMRSVSFMDRTSIEGGGGSRLVTTEIFGDIIGKSYLYLSDSEYDLLTAAIPDRTKDHVNLKEEFMKEVDNILSAAVITKLSNELNIKMFGDVPVLAKKPGSSVQDTIYNDFRDHAEEVYVNASFLIFETFPGMRLSFVWVMHNKIVQLKARAD